MSDKLFLANSENATTVSHNNISVGGNCTITADGNNMLDGELKQLESKNSTRIFGVSERCCKLLQDIAEQEANNLSGMLAANDVLSQAIRGVVAHADQVTLASINDPTSQYHRDNWLRYFPSGFQQDGITEIVKVEKFTDDGAGGITVTNITDSSDLMSFNCMVTVKDRPLGGQADRAGLLGVLFNIHTQTIANSGGGVSDGLQGIMTKVLELSTASLNSLPSSGLMNNIRYGGYDNYFDGLTYTLTDGARFGYIEQNIVVDSRTRTLKALAVYKAYANDPSEVLAVFKFDPTALNSQVTANVGASADNSFAGFGTGAARSLVANKEYALVAAKNGGWSADGFSGMREFVIEMVEDPTVKFDISIAVDQGYRGLAALLQDVDTKKDELDLVVSNHDTANDRRTGDDDHYDIVHDTVSAVSKSDGGIFTAASAAAAATAHETFATDTVNVVCAEVESDNFISNSKVAIDAKVAAINTDNNTKDTDLVAKLGASFDRIVATHDTNVQAISSQAASIETKNIQQNSAMNALIVQVASAKSKNDALRLDLAEIITKCKCTLEISDNVLAMAELDSIVQPSVSTSAINGQCTVCHAQPGVFASAKPTF